MLKSGEIISDSDSTTLTSMAQGEGPQRYQIHRIGILVGKNVQNSEHFLSEIVGTC